MKDLYRFPKCWPAARNTMAQQIEKLKEEVAELEAAFMDEPIECNEVIDESWDVVQVIEGILRKFPAGKVAKRKREVEAKNRKRGYYEQ